MNTLNLHKQVCFEAWMNCEHLLISIAKKKATLSSCIEKIIDECAQICMGTFHALKANSVNSSRLALLCVGICEECAEACETIKDEAFRKCAEACRTCSSSIQELAQQAV